MALHFKNERGTDASGLWLKRRDWHFLKTRGRMSRKNLTVALMRGTDALGQWLHFGLEKRDGYM